jgi:hypothetical protein
MVTKKSLLAFSLSAFVAAGITWGAQPANAGIGVPDHLKCYKVKDTRPVSLEEQATLLGSQFATEECKIVGKARLFCVPVAKQLHGEPFPTPEPQPLVDDRLCYKIKCKKTELPPELPVFDQFGPTRVTTLKPAMVCTPAFKGSPGLE